jgi:hypothetical protein
MSARTEDTDGAPLPSGAPHLTMPTAAMLELAARAARVDPPRFSAFEA